MTSFLVAAADPLPAPHGVRLRDVPLRHDEDLSSMLKRPLPLSRELLEHGAIVTDAHSAAAYAIAQSQLAYRKSIVTAVPKAFLVN